MLLSFEKPDLFSYHKLELINPIINIAFLGKFTQKFFWNDSTIFKGGNMDKSKNGNNCKFDINNNY